MRRRSLRSTLLAWNMGVVVSLLSLFGLGVTVVSQLRLRSELDAGLAQEAARAAELGPPPGPPRRPTEGQVPERFRPLYERARRVADIRQPRFLDREGRRLPPRRGPRPGPPPGGPFGGSFAPFDIGIQEGPGGPGFPGQPPPGEGPRPAPRPFESTVDRDGYRRALTGVEVLQTVDWEGEPVRVLSKPIVDHGHVVGVVQVARELRDLDNLAQSQLWTLALFVPIAAAAAAAAAVALANRALSPIGHVTRAASEIGGADLSRRLEVAGNDELADMARTFNGMLGRLEGAFADLGTANKRLADALEAQRRFTADASHELRTPLTRLRLAADVGKDPSVDETKLRDALAVSERASGAMTRLVDQLLTLARVDAGQLPVRAERIDARIAVAEALDGVPGSDRVEAFFPDHETPIHADPDHVRRIVTNLVENALRHTPAPRGVAVSMTDGEGVIGLEVRDEGEGIPPDHLDKVFDRFHRVDLARSGGGSGLGLAICRDLVRANGGEIGLDSQSGAGTRVWVRFPRAR